MRLSLPPARGRVCFTFCRAQRACAWLLSGSSAIWDSDMSADGRDVAWCTHSGCAHTLPVHTVTFDPRKRPPAAYRGARPHMSLLQMHAEHQWLHCSSA